MENNITALLKNKNTVFENNLQLLKKYLRYTFVIENNIQFLQKL